MTREKGESYLVIGPSWVGDMVMAQSLFISLKQQQPACRITVMAPAWTSPLLQRMPQVDDTIGSELGHGDLKFLDRRRIGKGLRARGFTTAIVLPNSFKSALIPFHARIRRRIGWRGEWRCMLLSDCRSLDADAYPLMVQRYLALGFHAASGAVDPYPLPSLRTDPEQTAAMAAAFGLSLERPVLAICPGAEFGDAKQWPARHYAALSEAFIAKGWQVWMFGSPNDQIAAEAIQADVDAPLLDRCVDLTGKTTLDQAIDLMAASHVVVSNDSGLMHIGAALNKPVVGIFGSTSPDFTPPLTEKVKLLTTDIECRPCFKRQCPFGHRRCLTELHPDRVIEAILQLSDSERRSGAEHQSNAEI